MPEQPEQLDFYLPSIGQIEHELGKPTDDGTEE